MGIRNAIVVTTTDAEGNTSWFSFPAIPPDVCQVLDDHSAAGRGGPRVQVYGGSTLVGSFFVYDLVFTGGVHVATADVTDDGVPDITTAAGFGGGPHTCTCSTGKPAYFISP
jgi:hypothetical protein